MSQAEFAILGAGAMGSIVGAHLARAGHSVVMLARTVSEPASLAGAGALIVAVKTPGTAAALAALRHAHFDVTLSIQNGPLKNELLVQAFGAERVLGALANTSGELLPGGEVL